MTETKARLTISDIDKLNQEQDFNSDAKLSKNYWESFTSDVALKNLIIQLDRGIKRRMNIIQKETDEENK